jgi:hypothetical protein
VPDEVGDQRAGDQLGVVVLRDVAGRGVLDGDIEAERATCAEDAHHSQRQPERARERSGVEAGERQAGYGRHQSGAECKALGRFGARQYELSWGVTRSSSKMAESMVMTSGAVKTRM